MVKTITSKAFLSKWMHLSILRRTALINAKYGTNLNTYELKKIYENAGLKWVRPIITKLRAFQDPESLYEQRKVFAQLMATLIA